MPRKKKDEIAKVAPVPAGTPLVNDAGKVVAIADGKPAKGPKVTPAKQTKKTTETWPKVTVGSHLTVTTYENGKTELKWDDEALARDIRNALAEYEASLAKPKRSRKPKDIAIS